MMNLNAFTTFLLLCFLRPWVSAAPIRWPELIVYNPPILTPTLGAVWTAGTTESCTWDTSGLPGQLHNATGSLVLGYLLEETGINEHLDLAHPLATDFPLSAGTVSFSVPADLIERDSYIVVLFGDSGNASPKFTIKAAAASASSEPSGSAGAGSLASTDGETSHATLPV